MRRKEREVLGTDQILEILQSCEVLRLGLTGEDGLPYVVPVHFGVKQEGTQGALYFHSAGEGLKNQCLLARPTVCFETDRLIRLLPHNTACGWSSAYESVIGWGTVSLLEGSEEKRGAMDAILAHYHVSGMPEYAPEVLARTALWRLDIDRMTGKRNLGK